ncbi:MAG: hypothetical protein AAFQ19_16395 [Pseudomonadota bacterium]
MLGRIAAAGREQRAARAMTLQKALRLTLAKVADEVLDLPMAVIGAVVQDASGDGLEDRLQDAALLMLLDGPHGAAGGVMIDPVVVGGVIQQQTVGTVHADVGQGRAMTRTDAAICAPLVDGMLARVVPILDDEDEKALITGYRFGAKVDSARTLALSLDAQDYVLVRLTVDIARGVRQGEITLVLPKPSPLATEATSEPGSEAAAKASQDMAKTVMGLSADLRMVLCQLHIPLKVLREMRVGQELVLPPGQFPHVQIVTATGRTVGRGVVGHVEGVRAVKPQRAPLHASHPLRRESDGPLVDMPHVKELPSHARRPEDEDAEGGAEIEVSEEEIAAAMQQLEQAAPIEEVDMPAALPAPSQQEMEVQIDAVPDLADLPDLDDLPDWADLPDLAMQAAG